MKKVSLLIKHAQVFNSYLKQFVSADVYVLDGKFFYIDREHSESLSAEKVLDAQGLYMLPGLIDIHMHIESSMMTPGPFGRFLASCGVTTIVSEPHEMANIKGMRGILEMIQAAEDAPIDIYYGIPSSVPSTNEALETTGGIIDFDAMKHLLTEKDVVCVGEIMNYRQIIKENDLEITKFLEYLRQERPNYVIEGHCPSLVGLDLAKFLYQGIDGDHTEHTLEEVKQRIENGMFMELQNKMLKSEILDYIREHQLYEYCSFVTDDTMADVLYQKGQLNYVVEKAIQMGFPLEQALYCATYTPSRRMHLYDRGVIAPGKLADFILVKNPSHLCPEITYKNGVEIFNRKHPHFTVSPYTFPKDFYESIQFSPLSKEDFRMPVSRFLPKGAKIPSTVTVRAIEVQPDRTQTKETLIDMPVKDGYIDWKSSGCLLSMVIERHGKNGTIGYGFLTGSCLKRGTVATTYFHDHHNLFVTGDNEIDMELAVKRIQQLNGGYLTVQNGKILSELALPVCGILSDQPLDIISTKLCQVRESLQKLGYQHNNPIMSLGTLGLPVSPALKLTDRGYVDVKKGAIVDLIVGYY
ncbi:MAG: adenine deaminase C-terminal domain-containing protein [Lachnospiraceae bacterium]|nr:adenine deaminase C-terminal domain-containing protein [Lachnospiraceae bacterium]